MPSVLAALLVAAGFQGPCDRLIGAHPGAIVVQRATALTPGAAGWAPASEGSYKALPVMVPLCRVEGTIEGTIGFELWLPASSAWNGRLLGAGVGGDAGVFNYADMSRRIGEGFATVTTDSGHKVSQAHWMTNAKARVDYEHRAVHLAALAAKALARDYYGRLPSRSYFTGCSGGGRQALKEMQNYAADYDGVIAGAPGPYMPLISVRMLWQALLQKQQPAAALTDGDWALYERMTVAACDSADGVRDGIIENPLLCRFSTRSLKCARGQASDCLPDGKLAMLERIVAPMPDEHGKPMDGGLIAGVRPRPGPPSPLLRAMWGDTVYHDPNWNEDSFRRTQDLARVNQAMPELRADRTSIAPFVARGGKAIIYQGWQDPSVIAGPTIEYYQKLARAQGGTARLARSVRLFMVPGMYHCRGGPGADQFGASGQQPAPSDPAHDMLWALIDWVEQGRAPDRIVAAKLDGGTTRLTRALCAFPQSARYDGKGDPTRAESYGCRVDPVLRDR